MYQSFWYNNQAIIKTIFINYLKIDCLIIIAFFVLYKDFFLLGIILASDHMTKVFIEHSFNSKLKSVITLNNTTYL